MAVQLSVKEYKYLIEELEMKEDIALYEKVKADKNESYMPLTEYRKKKEKIMPVYEVLLSKAARKKLATFPAFIHNMIIEDISNLSSVPRPTGCKKLKGYKNSYRIRVGDYRIIYE